MVTPHTEPKHTRAKAKPKTKPNACAEHLRGRGTKRGNKKRHTQKEPSNPKPKYPKARAKPSKATPRACAKNLVEGRAQKALKKPIPKEAQAITWAKQKPKQNT